MKVEVKVLGLDGRRDTLQQLLTEVASKRGSPVRFASACAARISRDETWSDLRVAVGDSEKTTVLFERSVTTLRGKTPLGGRGGRHLARVKRAVYDGERLAKRESAGQRLTTHKTARFMEYGCRIQPATPCLRLVFVTAAETAFSVFETSFKAEVDRAVQKLLKPNGGQ